MVISEVCPHCGAERPDWLGSSHFRYCYLHRAHDRYCCQGESAEHFFDNWWPVGAARPRGTL